MSGEGSVHGWGCTPTGEQPASTKPRFLTAFSRGWQRTTLYAIIIFLMVLVFLNIALTLWIVASLRLTMGGVGPLKIVQGGLQLDGEVYVNDHLAVSTITSRPGQPITLHSYRNFTMLVSNPDLSEHSLFSIKRDSIVCGGRTFEILDSQGNSVFKASREEVRVRADHFVIDGEGGVNMKSALQSPAVRSPPGSDLLLESQTRRLYLRAPQSVHIESRAGSIDITSQSLIKLDSQVGAIKIEAPNVYLTNIKEARMLPENISKNKSSKQIKVYQMCVCAGSGKIFLAAADGLCAALRDDDELCR